jgi:hypothetical protein
MASYLLIYERIEAPFSDWRPLLQQQAVVAAARVVLARGHSLLAPAHPDVLPLLAPVARDYARPFSGPEARREGPPVRLYGEPPSPDVESMRHLLRRTDWFGEGTQPLIELADAFNVRTCIVATDLRQAARGGDLVRVTALLTQVVYLRALATGGEEGLDAATARLLSAPPIAADDLLRDRLVGERPPAIDWFGYTDMERSLEPFVAFGVAFELALSAR